MFRTTKRRRSNSSQRESQLEMEYFKEVISRVGITMQYDEGPNIFTKEQSLIIRDFQRQLETHLNYPENVEQFIAGIKNLAKKPECFKKILLSSELQQMSDSENVIGMQQESVMRLFLSVDCLQSDVVGVLLEQVATHAVSDEDDTTWIRLLLGPLRYLSFIKDVKTLTHRLLEILDVATYSAQLEILNLIPEIIPDSEYDFVAKKLSKLLDENSELTGAIIDCFNYLNLSADIKSEIQDHILAIMQSTDSLNTFPSMFQFLISDCKQLDSILVKTRSALDSVMLSQSANQESDSDKVLTFEVMKSLAVSAKPVADGWITLITNIRVASDHKPVDFIILLMLHSMGGTRKHSVETLIKRKVKGRIIKNSLIETTLRKYLVPETLKDYLTSILSVASCLLQTHSEPLYVDCAKTIYCTTFANAHANKHQRQQILNDLVFLTGSGSEKSSIPTLMIINCIYEMNVGLLLPHTTQLMNLLDKIEDLSLGEVKLVFYLLCALICGPHADSTSNMLQNELHIMIRKQLSSSKRNIKYRGIIAAVAMAKNIATVTEEQSEGNLTDDSYNTVSAIPQGEAKQAATLLQLTSTTTNNCAIARGLYYDQLGQMIISSDSLDKYFVAWIFDVITNEFQNTYISEEAADSQNDIPLSIQYNLNKNDEVETPIYINIGEMVITTADENNLMLTMPALFRLLRLIHFKQHGSLTTIDALLGCGLVMPVIDADIGFDNFDTKQIQQIADCLFHCINLFRELISAFVIQKGSKLQLKVLNRLRDLVELEELLYVCMKNIPSHRLPPSYFHSQGSERVVRSPGQSLTRAADKIDKSKTLSKPKKAKRKAADTTNLTLTTQTQSKGRKPQPKDKEYSVEFREIDTDIILMFKHPLAFEINDDVKLYITIPQYKFLINDLVAKLQILMSANKKDALLNLNLIKLDSLVADCVRLTPNINRHLTQIMGAIKTLLDESDNIHDTPKLFEQSAIDLKVCFSLTLETIALLLNWTGFQNSKNLPLLREFLRELGTASSTQLNSVQKLIGEFLNRMGALMDCCLTLTAAVNLVNVLKALCGLTTDKGPATTLVEVSGTMLSTKWFNLHGQPDTGAAANANLDILLKAHFNDMNLATLTPIVSSIYKESANLSSKDHELTMYPSITKLNFAILYRAVSTALVEAVRTGLTGLTNTQHLELWFNTGLTMRTLMEIVKTQETRSNLGTYLKKMLGILKIFLTSGLPILEMTLKTKSERVIEILRLIQQNTRFIQNLCCHSKVSKDMGLIANVPQMRLTLETLIYRVKAMLVANNCATAFWMGNLKNKNLRGEEILSQTSEVSRDEEGEDSEDELPADESDNEREESTTSITSNLDDSNSELF